MKLLVLPTDTAVSPLLSDGGPELASEAQVDHGFLHHDAVQQDHRRDGVRTSRRVTSRRKRHAWRRVTSCHAWRPGASQRAL